MEVRNSLTINGKGLFSTKKYRKNEIIFTLSGKEFPYPTRETIHIGNNVHIYDSFGIFINHSFSPTIYIHGKDVCALRDIEPDEELVFNYNENEINMAAPFSVDGVAVQGKSQ